MLLKLQRDTAIACAVMAVIALVWRPDHPRLAGGVVGGGVLVGLAYWAIRGAVEQMTATGPPPPRLRRGLAAVRRARAGRTKADENGEIRPVSRAFPLVKFFTRHAILAVGAYVMMVRLHLDPIGMLIGVTSVVVAASLAAARGR